MNKKILVIMCLMALACTQSVLKKDQCNDCGQFKSQKDCTTNRIKDSCEWIQAAGTNAAKCQKKTPTQEETFKEYCQTIDKPDTNCANTFGCAYVNSVCTHFAGCSAYVKTTTTECQAISNYCISDGTSCVEAKSCIDYKSQTQCETTPSISGIKKCKWDNGACRDYICSEADSAFTTDDQCSTWLSGCITKQKGCWTKPLPNCSVYDSDANKCAYRGADGLCEQDTTSTKCKLKDCANAANTITTDAECKIYQDGCITNGKGCIKATVLPYCSSYTGDVSSCVGYNGLDGVCEGDVGGTKCRARKCENGKFTSDDLCKKYQSSCLTNGIACTSAKGLCSGYKGTITTCAAYIGSDGYCKGTSTTEAACVLKPCEDAPTTTSTNDACNKFQPGCVTNGSGCVSSTNLKSCTSYTGSDLTSCQSKVGSEGNCTWKTGTNCAARSCDLAPLTTTNCPGFFTGCVPLGSGAGCVASTSCDSTVKQASCEATTGCAWQSVCTSNTQCSDFKKKSICQAYSARVDDGFEKDLITKKYKTQRCAWLGGLCKNLECSDLTGTQYNTDSSCSKELSTCMSNGVNACILKTDCAKLTGTQATCNGYGGYCYNNADATDKTACRQRLCADNIDAKTNDVCEQFQPGCISNGKGCVNYTSLCTSFTGDQNDCNSLYGYKSSASDSATNYKTIQCYNKSTAVKTDFCFVKVCTSAENATKDSCSTFLTDTTCVFDGKDSCADPATALCTDYKGTNPTDQQCDDFKKDCIAKSSGGCIDLPSWLCTAQQGKVKDDTGTTACSNFYGGFGDGNKQKTQCAKYNQCADRACSDITPTTKDASICTNYMPTCRFLKVNSPCIAYNTCALYVVPDSTANSQAKFEYCQSTPDKDGKQCGYSTANNCESKTCEQLNTTGLTTKPDCIGYIVDDKVNNIVGCKSAGSICYTPGACTSYTQFGTATTTAEKQGICKLYQDTNGNPCTFSSGGTTCIAQTTCDTVNIQTSAYVCNDKVSNGRCQKVTNSACEETTELCTDYAVTSGLSDTDKKALCQGLKVIADDTTFGLGTAVYKSCIWKSSAATTCSAIASCSDIPKAISQADCDAQFSGCFYYGGLCYAAAACPSSIPTTLNPQPTNDTEKSLFCNSMNNGTNYCALNAAKNGCEENSTNVDCVYATPTGSPLPQWDGLTIADNTYCLAKTDKTKRIQCKAGAAGACIAGTCANIANPTSQGDCDKHILGCIFDAAKNKCWDSAVAADADCNNTAKVPFDTSSYTKATDPATTYCQKHYKQATGTIYCTHDQFKTGGAEDKCVAAGPCNSITLPTDTTKVSAYCFNKINAAGHKCAFTKDATACRDWDCYDITGATSQVDCDLGAPGKTCQYYKGTCYNTAAGCDKIPALTSGQKAYCDELTSNAIKCTYISGDNCTPRVACTAYDVSALTSSQQKKAACDAVLKVGTTDTKCTYVSGSKCVELGACATYDGTSTAALGPEAGSEETQCLAVTDADGKPCIKSGTAKLCKAQTCEDNDASPTACTNNASGCFYYISVQKCFTKKTLCSGYVPVGDTDAAKKLWCDGIINIAKDKCAWDGTSGCKDRACSDVTYYTDAACKEYLSTCKTDGSKCVVATAVACNSLSGTQEFCEYITDSTGKNKCKLATTPDTSTGTCKNKTCYDNVTATTDGECGSYPQCVKRGVGCVPYDTPCSSYFGTKAECETFKQYKSKDATTKVITYTYCSRDEKDSVLNACKDRVCSDNTTLTSNKDCNIYLQGCLTNGAGCIDPTLSCSAYKGDQATCSQFKGSSGADYCWNISTALPGTNCTKKQCSDIKGTDNATCNDGMKPVLTTDPAICVWDGTGCVIGKNKKCSTFNGTDDACATYIASDGPCKGTAGTKTGPCTPRICTEAPNNLVTDADCKKYHPTCSTTGYGCTVTTTSTAQTCASRSNETSCILKPECTWATQCYSQTATCSTYTNTNQSTCLNAKLSDGKKCAWTETGSVCRAQTCEDQPASNTTHDQCKKFSDTCTTTGAGCITRTPCAQYPYKSACLAASINLDGTGKCGWDDSLSKCRDRICSDKTDGKKDEDCNQFLDKCKTNGTSCVSGSTCGDFISAQYCLNSTTGPCLWVFGTCFNYDRCEDALMRTHAQCQKFSGMCTTNGVNCIPITSCKQTQSKVACVLGTDGTCGWLPSGSCQVFGQCSDATAATNEDCQSYGPNCLSDGTACITQGKCADYKTSTACGNSGTDGTCFWNSTSCKLKECSDVQSTTYDSCRQVWIGGVACTTNGTNCISQSTCSSYVEAGCYYGTDGDCIFAAAVGAATGATKTCRPKQCEDITDGKTNIACSVLINKKCVSNGASCIAKAACSTYKTVTACSGGGTDGTNPVPCAFTPASDADKVNGTCKTFSQCSDASKDQSACTNNSSCQWVTSGGTNSCQPHTCVSYASGANCKPIPSFDGASFTTCVLTNGACTQASPGTIANGADICYSQSAYTYTWNQANSKCEGCSASSVTNNSQNGTNNGTSNGTDTTEFGYTLSIISFGLLGFMA